MGWFEKKMPMTPREVAEDIDGSDGLTRVLAAAIDATDHKRGLYDMRQPVADLGYDEIDDLMGELVAGGAAVWTQRPSTAPSGRRDPGLIRPTAAGRRRLQAAIEKEQEAKSVRGRAAVTARFVQRAAGFATDVKTVVLAALAVVAGAVAIIQGCPAI